MHLRETGISLESVVNAISRTVDLVNDNVTRHHQRVAFISHMIGREMKLSGNRAFELVIAAAMHDIGALAMQGDPQHLHNLIDQDVEEHAETGYLLLKDFKPLAKVAEIIRFHHHQWDHGKGYMDKGYIVPFEGHIIHLADCVEMLINGNVHILHQKESIAGMVRSQAGSMFAPDAVDAFLKASSNDFFWLSLEHLDSRAFISEVPGTDAKLSVDELVQFSKIISYIIDFRSPYTAAHSSGVAAVAYALGQLAGFDKECAAYLTIAGYLHDLGKIAIPAAILDKQGGLTSEEHAVMRSHSFHTYRILSSIAGLEEITGWAAYHHERLDGSGYPFGMAGSDLPLGARIIAVADVYSALTEERPYREGVRPEKAAAIMKELADSGKLDKDIIHTLLKNQDDIRKLRSQSQLRAMEEYSRINKGRKDIGNGSVRVAEQV